MPTVLPALNGWRVVIATPTITGHRTCMYSALKALREIEAYLLTHLAHLGREWARWHDHR
jgi:hypothetical protein